MVHRVRIDGRSGAHVGRAADDHRNRTRMRRHHTGAPRGCEFVPMLDADVLCDGMVAQIALSLSTSFSMTIGIVGGDNGMFTVKLSGDDAKAAQRAIRQHQASLGLLG